MLLSICMKQVNVAPSGRIVGLNFCAWMEAARANGFDSEMMSILFEPIEDGITSINQLKNDSGE